MQWMQKQIEAGLQHIDYNQMSWPELGSHFGCDERTVRANFKRLGVKKKVCRVTARKRLDKIQQLMGKGYSNALVGKKLGIPTKRVSTFLKKKGLSNAENRGALVEFTEEEYQVILGSILGDGSLQNFKKSRTGARLVIRHCIEQQEYINYKFKLLKRFCKGITTADRYDIRFKTPDYQSVSLQTRNYRNFLELRKKWYTPEKRISKDILKLEPLGLAIWFMDDGFQSFKTVMISTDCFQTHSDKTLIKKVFSEKFGIEVIIRKNHRLYVRQKSYPKFRDLIEPYMIPSMMYKLPPKQLEFR
jgi:hypothetical protein